MIQYYNEIDEDSDIPVEYTLITSHGEVQAATLDSLDIPMIPVGSNLLFIEDDRCCGFIYTIDWSDEVASILQSALSNYKTEVVEILAQNDGYTILCIGNQVRVLDSITFNYSYLSNIH